MPEVMLINEALLAAIHEQPALAVTLTFPVPPLEAKFWPVELIE
jgi:hypothetical protein